MADLSHDDSAEMDAFGLAFTPDSKSLVVGGDGGRMVLLDLARHQATRATANPSDATVTSLAVDASGTKLLSTSLGGGRLWKLPELTKIAAFDFEPSAGGYADITADGQRALFAGGMALVQWAIDEGGAYGDPLQSAPRSMGPARFLSKHEILVAEDRELAIVDVEPRRLGFHAAEVHSLAIDRQHALAASGDASGLIRLWRLDRGVSLATPLVLDDGDLTPVALALSPDGRRAAVAATDVRVDALKGTRTSTRGIIQMFDVATGKPIGSPRGVSHGDIAGVRFTDTGDVVETEGPPTIDWLASGKGPTGVSSASIGDGWAATIRRNDEIALFDARSRRQLAVLVPGAVSFLRATPGCLSPSIVADRMLAMVNGVATVLDFGREKLLRRACDLSGRPSPGDWQALGAPGTFAEACGLSYRTRSGR